MILSWRDDTDRTPKESSRIPEQSTRTVYLSSLALYMYTTPCLQSRNAENLEAGKRFHCCIQLGLGGWGDNPKVYLFNLFLLSLKDMYWHTEKSTRIYFKKWIIFVIVLKVPSKCQRPSFSLPQDQQCAAAWEKSTQVYRKIEVYRAVCVCVCVCL